MVSDLLGAWSAALAAWFIGGAVLCAIRIWDLWRETDLRGRVLMIGITLSTAGWGWHQTYAEWAWLHDIYGWSFVLGVHGIGYRVLMTLGVLCTGGAMSWHRCGHKGWLGLLLVGLLAGGVAVLVS